MQTAFGALHVDQSYSSCLPHASVHVSDSAAMLILEPAILQALHKSNMVIERFSVVHLLL